LRITIHIGLCGANRESDEDKEEYDVHVKHGFPSDVGHAFILLEWLQVVVFELQVINAFARVHYTNKGKNIEGKQTHLLIILSHLFIILLHS
jgi:hypothetical protein